MFSCEKLEKCRKKPVKNLHVTRPIIDPIKRTIAHAFLDRLSTEYRFFKDDVYSREIKILVIEMENPIL